jgi:DNA-binding MarR family transcriptional regulator
MSQMHSRSTKAGDRNRSKLMTSQGRNSGSVLGGPGIAFSGPQRLEASTETLLQQWKRERPDLDLGPLGLFAAIAHAYWLTEPRIDRLLADHGLARGTFDVLTVLRRAGPPYTLSPKQLAQSLILSGAGMTSRLDKLEGQKLIVRLPEPRDRRALKIKLTRAGMRLVDVALPDLIAAERALSSRLTDAEMRQLTRLLEAFARSVQLAPSGVDGGRVASPPEKRSPRKSAVR